MPELDLDSLAALAEAATPGEMYFDGIVAQKFRSMVGPVTVLALIAEAREAQRLRGEVAALAGRWQVEADAGRDAGDGHPLLVQTYANHAHDLRALIGGGR